MEDKEIKQSVTFVSKHAHFNTYIGEKRIRFIRNGNSSIYVTNDADEIEALRKDAGTYFVEVVGNNPLPKPESKVVQGFVTSESHQHSEEEANKKAEELMEKFRLFTDLKAKVINSQKGSIKKTAEEADIEAYKTLCEDLSMPLPVE